MIALALLASHLVGDFVFQTRWQANGKLDDHWLRTRHVWAYMLAFVWMPFLDVPLWRIVVFAAALAGLHWLTDTRRFYSTVGDLVGWQLLDDAERRWLWQEQVGVADDWTPEQSVPEESWLDLPTPNPWPALPLMIDQTLHVVQLAALGWLLV